MMPRSMYRSGGGWCHGKHAISRITNTYNFTTYRRAGTESDSDDDDSSDEEDGAEIANDNQSIDLANE